MNALANPAAAYMTGLQYAQQAKDMERQNALAQLYQTQGAGIANGDQGALNALAALDPMAAMGVRQNALGMQATQLGMQQTQQSMAFDAEKMQMVRDQSKAAAAEHAAKLTAEQRAAEAAKMESVLRGAAAVVDNRPAFEAFLSQNGVDPSQIPAGSEKAFIAMTEGGLDALKQFTPDPVTPLSPQGKFNVDQQRGFVPPGTAFDNGAPTVNVNAGGGTKLYDTLDTKQGEMFGALIDQGNSAARNVVVLDQMSSLLDQIPTGMQAAIQRFGGQLGVQTEGLDKIQAAEAMINQLVPQQRAPGSGTMSDRDLELFKSSLPSLINTPEGNKIIVKTMKGLANYSLAQAQIAQQVADRTITPAEGRKRLSELPNPLAEFQNAPATGAAPENGVKVYKFDAEGNLVP